MIGKKHRIAQGLALVAVLATATACKSSATSSHSLTNSPATSAATVAAAAATTSAAKATAPAAPVTLLSVSGNGQKQTANFTAAGSWTLAYTYDCSAFGGSGNFIVDVYGSDGSPSFTDPGVNLIGAKGADSTIEHGKGTFYLSVDSECAWTITVTG